MNEIIENSPLFRAIYKVWDQLRTDGQVVPTRDSFNPMALARVLPNVVLVERVARGQYEYRVMGTAVSERLQANPVGFNMLEYFVPQVRGFLTDWFEAMTFHPCAVLTRTHLVYESSPDRAATVLGLPLLGKGGNRNYYLFGNEVWRPKPGDNYGVVGNNLGGIITAGEQFLQCQGFDIGAGVPPLANQPMS